jgi:hypothetical protein
MFSEKKEFGMNRAGARQFAQEGQQRKGALLGTERTGTAAKEADCV